MKPNIRCYLNEFEMLDFKVATMMIQHNKYKAVGVLFEFINIDKMQPILIIRLLYERIQFIVILIEQYSYCITIRHKYNFKDAQIL